MRHVPVGYEVLGYKLARRGSAEHLIYNKSAALRTATAWMPHCR